MYYRSEYDVDIPDDEILEYVSEHFSIDTVLGFFSEETRKEYDDSVIEEFKANSSLAKEFPVEKELQF